MAAMFSDSKLEHDPEKGIQFNDDGNLTEIQSIDRTKRDNPAFIIVKLPRWLIENLMVLSRSAGASNSYFDAIVVTYTYRLWESF